MDNLPRKYIRKMFKHPEHAYCKKCKSRMILLAEDASPGKVIFECTKFQCSNIIDLTEFKKTFEIRRDKVKRSIIPYLYTPYKQTILKMHFPRLKDTYYYIDSEMSYNPVKKFKKTNNVLEKAHNDEHSIIIDKIFKLLKDAQK